MDLFTRFNGNKINDRQCDTLIGISKGLTADGKINQNEAEFLLTWLIQSQQVSSHPIIINLLHKVDSMLEDGILDSEESKELFDILHRITGESSELGEIAKTSSLPIDDPAPLVYFEGKSFLFTGTFAFGSRKQCHEKTKELGGKNSSTVTKSVNYLVLGTYVTDSWAHENFGRKIEKAMSYRDAGVPLAIITEEHWVNSADI